MFKTYLNDNDIKIESRDGAVTLTGFVSETQAVCLLYKPSYMAFMPDMTDSDDGFSFPHQHLFKISL